MPSPLTRRLARLEALASGPGLWGSTVTYVNSLAEKYRVKRDRCGNVLLGDPPDLPHYSDLIASGEVVETAAFRAEEAVQKEQSIALETRYMTRIVSDFDGYLARGEIERAHFEACSINACLHLGRLSLGPYGDDDKARVLQGSGAHRLVAWLQTFAREYPEASARIQERAAAQKAEEKVRMSEWLRDHYAREGRPYEREDEAVAWEEKGRRVLPPLLDPKVVGARAYRLACNSHQAERQAWVATRAEVIARTRGFVKPGVPCQSGD